MFCYFLSKVSGEKLLDTFYQSWSVSNIIELKVHLSAEDTRTPTFGRQVYKSRTILKFMTCGQALRHVCVYLAP